MDRVIARRFRDRDCPHGKWELDRVARPHITFWDAWNGCVLGGIVRLSNWILTGVRISREELWRSPCLSDWKSIRSIWTWIRLRVKGGVSLIVLSCRFLFGGKKSPL